MKKLHISFFALALCCFGITSDIEACSPAKTPVQEMVERYNSEKYMAVEGYYISGQRFVVTRSSYPSIETGKEYDVLEYGPFGSMCEMYEVKAHLKPEFLGIEKPRILILYKDRSVNGKLVAPIFYNEGLSIDVSNNKAVVIEDTYDWRSGRYPIYEYSVSLDKIRNRLFENKTESLEWKVDTSINKPHFPSGEFALREYLSENTNYSQITFDNIVQVGGWGPTVHVQFWVEHDGSISNVEVGRGTGWVCNGCDEEAVRLVKEMPNWLPAIERGKPIRAQYAIPVNFRRDN